MPSAHQTRASHDGVGGGVAERDDCRPRGRSAARAAQRRRRGGRRRVHRPPPLRCAHRRSSHDPARPERQRDDHDHEGEDDAVGRRIGRGRTARPGRSAARRSRRRRRCPCRRRSPRRARRAGSACPRPARSTAPCRRRRRPARPGRRRSRRSRANTQLHVDARGGEHAAVVDAGADHHADARAWRAAPQADADHDRREQHQRAGRSGTCSTSGSIGRAVDPAPADRRCRSRRPRPTASGRRGRSTGRSSPASGRRSCPCMWRKMSTCISRPSDRGGRGSRRATASSHEPVCSPTIQPT